MANVPSYCGPLCGHMFRCHVPTSSQNISCHHPPETSTQMCLDLSMYVSVPCFGGRASVPFGAFNMHKHNVLSYALCGRCHVSVDISFSLPKHQQNCAASLDLSMYVLLFEIVAAGRMAHHAQHLDYSEQQASILSALPRGSQENLLPSPGHEITAGRTRNQAEVGS